MAALAIASVVAGCGGSAGSTAERPASYPVSVLSSFPRAQQLAEQTSFTVRVKNVGMRAIPDVAVTVLNPRYGTAAAAFGMLIPRNGPGQPILASRSRPVWIVNQAPGPCGYSCHSRGPGAAATAYTNTWALGRLAPGHTVAFRWKLTAVAAGRQAVEYEVAAALDGSARAVLRSGAPARGRFRVTISSAPPLVSVQSNGRVIARTSAPRAKRRA